MPDSQNNHSKESRRRRLDFLKVAAHQLKSPIGTIQTSLKTLLEGFADPVSSSQRAILEGAERKTRDMLKLIGYVLELSRMESISPREFKAVDLNAMLAEILADCEKEARRRKLYFEIRIARKLPPVLAYGPGLREAFVNLLDNAFKYTPRDGKVRFVLNWDDTSGLLSGKVIDSGIGIPAADRERIFEEFYRASNASKLSRQGSGLGMSIIKQAIELHGGSIGIKSGKGEGTTVVFSLNLKKASIPRAGEGKEENRFRIVVVGGVAAGPKAAAKARRNDQNASITIVEKGEFLSYSGCGLPYYISGKVNDQNDLMTTIVGVNRDPEYFKSLKDIKVLNQHEATAIDRGKKLLQVRELRTGRNVELPYDRLVLTTGARALLPEIPGMDLDNIFTLHRIRDAEDLRRILAGELARDAVIVGGGLIGTETAEALTEGGARVTVVEKRDRILEMLDPEMAALVERHMRARGVKIYTGTAVARFEGEGKVAKIVTSRGEIPADFVLLATGVGPEVRLAREAGLELGTTGAIRVNKFLATSDPDIYAGGDCVENRDLVTGRPVYMPLGSTANKHGRIIGINVTGGKESFPGITTTTILKVFDYNVSRVGLSAGEAEAAGYRVVTSICPALDKASFYPGSRTVFVKLVVDRNSERLLGAQVIGPGDVSKRIDIAAALIFKEGTVSELATLDLAYAPPYSEAIDSIAQSANIVKNKLAGTYRGISPLRLEEKLRTQPEDIFLIDVSTEAEFEKESIPGSTLIPLGTLRGRLGELPQDREIVLVSSTGLRAYEAALIMQAEGFSRVRALDGGVAVWPFARS